MRAGNRGDRRVESNAPFCQEATMKMIHQHPEDHMASRASWFALGLLSGAAVALLTSPMTGSDNRQMLRRRMRQAADAAGGVVEEGGSFIEGQRHRVNDMVERGRAQVQAFGSRVNEAFEQGKSAYRDTKDQVRSTAEQAGDAVRQTADDLTNGRNF
jgi:gas vesicle protein